MSTLDPAAAAGDRPAAKGLSTGGQPQPLPQKTEKNAAVAEDDGDDEDQDLEVQATARCQEIHEVRAQRSTLG